MYQAPGGQAPPAQRSQDPQREAAPGPAAAPSPTDDPDPSRTQDAADTETAPSAARRTPEDPYVAARPARPTRPARTPPRAAPDEATAWLDAHNRVREKHCAAALTWSPKLAQVAQRWANSLRDKGCLFGHSGGSLGENLAAGTAGTLDPGSVVKMWYDEVAQYRFPDGGFSMKTGHFTQVVWRGTKQVGCGRSLCKGMDIWVCEYDPAGNWEGQYRQNVLPPGC
jgi:uncharacterized protein YkwD